MACLALFTAGVWGGTLRNGFVFDDLLNVVGNRWITDWRTLPEAFTHHAAGFDPGYATSFYRPLMHVFYALVYALAGPAPWAFHLLNVALHVAAVACAYGLTAGLLRRWRLERRYRYLPLIAAVVFSVHPVHTEAVAWVAGISDVSYTLFGLASLMLYVRAFGNAALAPVSGGLLLASMLSKETGAVFLLLMVLLEWIERRDGARWTTRAAAIRLAPALGAAAVYAAIRLAALGSLAPSAGQHPHDLPELVAAAAGLFARYLGLLVAPVRLSAMQPVPPDAGFGDPAVLAGLFAGAAVVAFCWWRRRSPRGLLPVAMVVLPILPVLYVPAIEGGVSVLGERYLYLPVLGIGWGLGLALEEARARFPRGGRAAMAVVACVAVAGSAAVIVRSRVWADSLSLWSDAVAKSPRSAPAHEGLCFALYDAKRYAEALRECDTALAIDPTRIDARINRGTTLLALGRAHEAKAELDAVLARRPDSPVALVNRGLACMVLGRIDEAIGSYERAVEIDPRFAEAHNDLGVALVFLGRAAEALPHFEQAVRFAPDNPEYRANLSSCPR